MITEGQRLQYLEAMGIQAWISRERASFQNVQQLDSSRQSEVANPASAATQSRQKNTKTSDQPATFEIGPGSGSTLLLCSQPEEAATPLASDIARCLVEAPVWGWLSRDRNGSSVADTALSLERAIDERLFTRVLIFCGESDAGKAGNVEVLTSARIIYAPPMSELARQPEHKRRLWTQLVTHGWCAHRG